MRKRGKAPTRKRGKAQPAISSFFKKSDHDPPAPTVDTRSDQDPPAPTLDTRSDQDPPAPTVDTRSDQDPPAPTVDTRSDQDPPTPTVDTRSDQDPPAPTVDTRSDQDPPAPTVDTRSDQDPPAPTVDTRSDQDPPAPTADTRSDQDPPASTVDTAVDPRSPKKRKKASDSEENVTSPSMQEEPDRKFCQSWLAEFEWLVYDGDVMYCAWCRQYKQTSNLATGTRSFRKTALQKHPPTGAHVTAKAARDKRQPSVIRGMKEVDRKRAGAAEAALRTVYWLVKEEVANRKYASLLELQREQGLAEVKNLNAGRNATHTSPTTFNELLRCLNEVVERRVTREVNASPCVAIGIDESTDRSSEKHVVVVVRYVRVHTAELITTFLKCEKVNDGKAPTIYGTTRAVLDNYGIPVRKVLGLGMDGAAVMSSDMNGVTGLLHRDNPFALAVHCVCHRLQLAVSQAAKNIPQIKSTSLLVDSIYNYIMLSPNRLAEFNALVDVLGEEYLKLKHSYEIRWLSMGEAVRSVIENFRSLAVYTEEQAAEGDPVAIGLHQQLTSFLPMGLLHLLADVLDATNHLSKIFQYRDITFSVLRSELNDCLEILEGMRGVDGIKLARFVTSVQDTGNYLETPITMRVGRGGQDPVETLNAVKTDFLDRLLDNLRARFPQLDLLDAMKVFEPQQYPDDDDNIALAYWGRHELNVLLNHYAEDKVSRDGNICEAYINRLMCEGQFGAFKQAVATRYKGEQREENGVAWFHYYRPNELLEKMFAGDNAYNQRIFGEVFKLMCYSLVVLVSNAEAERVFSCQNRIKTKTRTLLGIEQLDRLIRLSYAKIPMADFDFAAAREIYLQDPRRL
ncbi:zinc finger protein 862-like [Branchiostoma floridae]|uniref:Zinc finger protein 862-like n=1 Tax=Branchiostoma floridae TaxID=7739 RepID=A0A9J7L0D2_BRAFL|nr:zinc finger protein 862-like [Branchiostoma floridae]